MLYITDSQCPECGVCDIDIKTKNQRQNIAKPFGTIWGNCLNCGEISYSYKEDIIKEIKIKPTTLKFVKNICKYIQ